MNEPTTLPAQAEMQRLKQVLQDALAGKPVNHDDALAIIRLQSQLNNEVMQLNISLSNEIEKRDTEIINIMLGFIPVFEILGFDEPGKQRALTESDFKKIDALKREMHNNAAKRAAIENKVKLLNEQYGQTTTYDEQLHNDALEEYQMDDGFKMLTDFAKKIFTDGRRIWRELKQLTSLSVYVPIFHARYADRLTAIRNEQRVQKSLKAIEDEDDD